jgi:hypothetical protein
LIEDFPRSFFLPFLVSLSFAVAFPAVVRDALPFAILVLPILRVKRTERFAEQVTLALQLSLRSLLSFALPVLSLLIDAVVAGGGGGGGGGGWITGSGGMLSRRGNFAATFVPPSRPVSATREKRVGVRRQARDVQRARVGIAVGRHPPQIDDRMSGCPAGRL